MPSKLNLKVLILESDFYAAQAINGYLAWDRRTRVIAIVATVADTFQVINSIAEAELPDVILFEAEVCPTPDALADTIRKLRDAVPRLTVICLGHMPDMRRAAAAAAAGARAYLLRNDLKLQIVGAIVYALDHEFVITAGLQSAAAPDVERLPSADVLPQQREYPEMTERIRQALWLCVVEGMPAHLAADEMGISPHTIRSYIKEGYRILEAHDDTNYPDDMGPLERAFMRFTALEEDEEDKKPPEEPGG